MIYRRLQYRTQNNFIAWAISGNQKLSGSDEHNYVWIQYNKPSAPMDTSLTPLLAMKSRALLTLAILWNRILPRSGLGNVSPEITSRSSINLSPFRKSSSMFSIAVPAFRRCELHHAVKVCKVIEEWYINYDN